MILLIAALLAAPIHYAADHNFCLDVAGGKPGNNAKIQLYKCNQTAAQDFDVGQPAAAPAAAPTVTPLPPLSVPSAAPRAGLIDSATPARDGYHVAYSDEFNGTALDLTKWNLACDGSGGGNNELEYYLPFPSNHFLSDGKLTIRVLKQPFLGQAYTSAKLTTLGIFDFTYGYFEARIKIPRGQGLWPAFWTLPKDNLYGQWPTSGELDAMEILGGEPGKLYGTAHFGPAWPNQKQLGGVKVATPGTDYSQDYHVYGVDWQADHIDWYLDGVKYYTVSKGDGDWQTGDQGAATSSDGWPFNIPHYVIFNMAMGGQWPGAPDPSITQGDLLVDWVRVYQKD